MTLLELRVHPEDLGKVLGPTAHGGVHSDDSGSGGDEVEKTLNAGNSRIVTMQKSAAWLNVYVVAPVPSQ